MPSSEREENERRVAYVKDNNLTHCEWDDNGLVRAISREPAPPRAVPVDRPVADLAKRIAAEREARHRIMFAASGTKPAVEHPKPPPSVVPRAVRAKQDARGAR